MKRILKFNSRVVIISIITLLQVHSFQINPMTSITKIDPIKNKKNDKRNSCISLPISSLHFPSSLKATPMKNKNNNNEDFQLSSTTEPQFPRPPPPPRKKKKRNFFRLKLFQILNEPLVEVLAASAVLLSSFLVALSTLNDLPPEAYVFISDILRDLDIIFAVDFFVRWYAAGLFKVKYLAKPQQLIDIVVVIIPLFVGTMMPLIISQLDLSQLNDSHWSILSFTSGMENSSNSGLQNLLLLRTLRLRRVLINNKTFSRFQMGLGIKPKDVRPYQLELARVLLSVFTLLSVASGLIYTAEHDVNPEIPDYFSALYFGLTTLTTVGFGDIVPMTSYGRLVVAMSILVGIAVIPSQAAKLVDVLVEFQKEQEEKKVIRIVGKATTSQSKKNKSNSSQKVNPAATDGKGPSGVYLEIPSTEDGPVSNYYTKNGGTMRSCKNCGTKSHRRDAKFCWSCGTKL